MRIVVTDPDNCVACRDCEYACAFEHGGDFGRESSYIRVNFYPEERVCVPLTCTHCTDDWCLEVCPAGAIERDPETGVVEIDAGRCAGCKICLLACPFGNIHFDPVQEVSRKCDLCGGSPACVRSCTADALQFAEVEEAADTRRETVDARLRLLFRRDTDES